MKIGINFLGYECKEFLPKVFEAWKEYQKEEEVYISVTHGIFPETHKLGFPIESTDGSIEELIKLYENGTINDLVIADQPMFEKDLRNLSLAPLFNKNVDLIWLLDADEHISIDEIRKIVAFISSNNHFDWFKINFKNYVFDEKTYVNDFIAPRIWRTDRNEGIAGFYYDNEIMYKNGKSHTIYPNTVIPRDVAFPRHLSWSGSESYLKRKCAFQEIHHNGLCSYKWDEKQKRLIFNDEYYKKAGINPPILYKD